MRRGTWHPGGHNGQASHHGGRQGQGSHHGGPGPHPTIRPPPPLAPPNHHSSSYYTQPQHRTDQSFSNHAREPTSKRNQERGHREAYWDDHRERSRERGVYQGGGEYSDIRRRPDNGGRSARLGYPPERELSGDSSRGRENERTGHFGQGRNMNQMGNFESGRYENTIHPNQPFDGYAWESTDYDYEVDARHHGITGATHKEVRVSTSHSFQEPTRPARSEPSSSSLSLPPPVYGIGHPPPGYLPTGGPPPSVPLRSNTPLEPPRFNPSHELHAPNSDPGPSSLGPASTSPVPSLAPPPAPHIGSLTPESQPKAGSRDPRRRLRDGERESERPTVSASGGLGIRSDIYENQAPHAAENRADASYHQPEPPVSQPEEQEVKFSDTDAFSKLPDSTVVDVEEDTKDTKEAKTVVSTNYRCTFCPSPGLVPLTEKISHQALHASSCFSCAACGGRRTFPEFEQLVLHIHSLHLVTDSEMVRETILLPESGPGALRVFRCGVTNCGVTFTAQSEVVLRAHMEAVHGSYYVKLGKGKYLLRFCRICGEERCFSSEKELLTHILTSHPPDQFGQRLSDGEEEAVAEVKQEVVEAVEDSTLVNSQCQEGETLTSGLMEATASRPRTVETASSLSPEPSTSSVLAIEAIELATQSTSAGHSSKEEKKRKRKRKNLKMESSGQESSESSSDSEEEHVGKKKKKKSKKEGKEKSKKKIPIEVKKKKFKDQVGKMTPEEIKEHILKMKEKADKLLKKKSVKEKVEVMKKKSVLSNPPDPKDPWPKIFKDKTAHYFCLFCNIYAGKLEKWLLHRAHVDHITAYCSTKEAALQRLDCDEIELQECVIGEEKFEQAPLGQCKECFQVFWSSADPESHLKDGRCLRTAQKHQASNASEKERSRSASPPFIKWKPLRKPTEKSLEQGEIEERSKKEELKANERLVSYRSPSHRKPSLSPPRPVSTPSGGPSHVVSQSGARYKRYGSISPPRRTPSPPKPVPPPNDGRGQVVSVTGAKYKRYGSISPPPRSPRPRSRTKSPPSGYSQRKMRRRSPSYPKRSRSKSSSRGRSSRSHGRKSRSQRRWSRSPGRRSRSPWSPPRRSRSPRSPLRRSRSPRWRSRSPTRRSRSPASRRRRRSSGGGGSPTYSPYRRPSTPPIPRSPRSSSPQVVGYRQSGWSRTSSHARSSRRWRSPTPPPRPEPVLTQEEREERLEEESRLLERLRNEKSKELSTTDLREKLESKKCVMLDSRGEVTVEGGKEEKRVCPICSNKFNDDSLLLQHMKMEHRRDMFGCSKCSRDKQPAIGWSIEVLVQHLASTHELDVSISEAISGFLAIPESLHKVTCKLCPPPHILGSKGFWLAGDVSEHMVSIEEHFEQVHLMSERSHIMGKLELACRGCDFILPHTGANKVPVLLTCPPKPV